MEGGEEGEEEATPDADFGGIVSIPAETALHVLNVLELHPTQLAVGMQQVEFKRSKLQRKKLHKKPAKLARFLEEHPIPGVLGPGNAFYIVDHHHLACALQRLGIEWASCVTLADWSAEPTPRHFWHKMEQAGYLWRSSPAGDALDLDGFLEALPDTILGLVDDPYRSLAALVRGAGGFTKVRVPFSEFQWANWLRTRLPGLLPAGSPAAATAVAAAAAAAAAAGSNSTPPAAAPPLGCSLGPSDTAAAEAAPPACAVEVDLLSLVLTAGLPHLWEPDHPHVVAQALLLAASPHAAGLPGYQPQAAQQLSPGQLLPADTCGTAGTPVVMAECDVAGEAV